MQMQRPDCERYLVPDAGGHVSIELTEPMYGNYIGFDRNGCAHLFRNGRMVCLNVSTDQVMWLERDLAVDPGRWRQSPEENFARPQWEEVWPFGDGTPPNQDEWVEQYRGYSLPRART